MTTIPRAADNVSSTLGSISNTLVDHDLSWYMCEREQDGRFAASIGSMNTLVLRYISDSEPDDNDSSSADGDMTFDLDSEGVQEQVEEFFSHATNASRPHGVTPKHLSKVWHISTEDARRTISTTTQTSVRTQDSTLSCNYSTNDRMLRYQHIQDYFFMDTFFATKKGGRSSRGHTCCQLFVTDKGFIYIVPMRRKSEILQVMKQFAKEIGAPTSIIADMASEQMSQEVRKFCNDIGTTLQALEEGTPWSNKAELYIEEGHA